MDILGWSRQRITKGSNDSRRRNVTQSIVYMPNQKVLRGENIIHLFTQSCKCHAGRAENIATFMV